LSKPARRLDLAVRVVFFVLLAVLVLGGLGAYVILFFIPIFGWFVWRDQDRIRQLEKRLAELERPTGQKPGQP
jgi:hypothetical protein